MELHQENLLGMIVKQYLPTKITFVSERRKEILSKTKNITHFTN